MEFDLLGAEISHDAPGRRASVCVRNERPLEMHAGMISFDLGSSKSAFF